MSGAASERPVVTILAGYEGANSDPVHRENWRPSWIDRLHACGQQLCPQNMVLGVQWHFCQNVFQKNVHKMPEKHPFCPCADSNQGSQGGITEQQDVTAPMHNLYSSPEQAHLSRHAKVQMQRRCIPMAAVDLILGFAPSAPAGNGTQRYRFDKESWATAAEHLGSKSRAFEKFRNAYIIEANDGTVVTAAWLY